MLRYPSVGDSDDYPPGDWRNSPEMQAYLQESREYLKKYFWFGRRPTLTEGCLVGLVLLVAVGAGTVMGIGQFLVSEYKKEAPCYQQNTERIMDSYDTSRDGVLDHEELSNLLGDRKKFNESKNYCR